MHPPKGMGKQMVLSFERAASDHLTPLMPQLDDASSTYAVLLSRDAATGRYRATVPDLPGFKCEADSPAEATSIIRDAVSAWMHTMRSNGKCVPEPVEHTLAMIEIGSEPSLLDERSAAQQFAEVVSHVLDLTEQARREFLVAEAAVMDERFTDAIRHAEWSMDLLMQAHTVLSEFQPHGELERVHKLFSYGIAQSMQGARTGLQGTCEQDVETVRRAEELYVQGMEAIKTGLAELRRFVTQS
jgi:predicted RNase H-like HicB family nuclease